MSMEASAVIGGVAVMNKRTSNPLEQSPQVSALSKLGSSGSQSGAKKILDTFTAEDEAILATITHGFTQLHLHS